MYFVTMTDTFMSNWGMAEGKINKLIFECETYEQAEIVFNNAQNRSDQKYIKICTRRPYYNNRKYYPQIKTIKDYPSWYEKDYFKRS